ncbi:DUF5011 domain-containing protein [Salicibibacter cibarius]|uniref:DUF5011 domain-containing protein n=1 Tax=Salicibibacter cibarius TaxID=2743000 RepID=A0A7T7CA78_9BACI|nr:DUF5011 domain-containing protein [Salicibibacter cibarius]QQK74609.1 DUF5011 domain-containing protein [Salicibibacter cibarius]
MDSQIHFYLWICESIDLLDEGGLNINCIVKKAILIMLLFPLIFLYTGTTSVSAETQYVEVEEEFEYVCGGEGITDTHRSMIFKTMVPESVVAGQEFHLTNTSVTVNLSSLSTTDNEAYALLLDPTFSISAENEETTITKEFEGDMGDLWGAEDIPIPNDDGVDVGQFKAGGNGEVVLKADEITYTEEAQTGLPIPISYDQICTLSEDEEDSTIAIIDIVKDTEPPEDPVGSIELDGNEEMELEVGDDFEEPGFTVVDEDGHDITDEVDVNVEGDVDTTTEGTYELTYSVEDNENIDSVTRTVTVVEPEEPGDPDPDPDPEGSNFHSGTGSPEDDLGEVGDHYLDTEAMELFVKEEDGWNSLGVLRGEDGEPGDQGPPGEDGTMWYTGEGEPDADLGVEGDLYLDEDSGDVYQKEDGEWGKIVNLQGPPGDCDCPDDNGEDNGSGANGSNGFGGINGSNGSSNGGNGSNGSDGNNGSSNGGNGLGIGNNDRDNGNGSGYNGGNGYTGDNGSGFDRDRGGGALPDTAGNTPLMILIGSLMAIAGGALLFRRKLSLT